MNIANLVNRIMNSPAGTQTVYHIGVAFSLADKSRKRTSEECAIRFAVWDLYRLGYCNLAQRVSGKDKNDKTIYEYLAITNDPAKAREIARQRCGIEPQKSPLTEEEEKNERQNRIPTKGTVGKTAKSLKDNAENCFSRLS